MENVAIPNLYSPIDVPGQNNIEAVGDLPIGALPGVKRQRCDTFPTFHAKGRDPRIRTRKRYMGGYASFVGQRLQVRSLARPCHDDVNDGKSFPGKMTFALTGLTGASPVKECSKSQE